jgi:putative tributyrin esterase
VLKFNFLSKELGMQTNVTVILPSFGYTDMLNKRKEVYVPGMKFQTLYLLHGGSGDDSDYVNFSNIVRYAEDNKLAVVMPSACNSFYSNLEYGPKFWDYLSEELPKVCRSMFPLSDKREDNFVAGLSMGAIGAMKFALKKPEMFIAALCMSCASVNPDKMVEYKDLVNGLDEDGPAISKQEVIYGDLSKYKGSDEDMYLQAKRNIEMSKILPKFFMTCGSKDDILDIVIEAKDYLNELGYDVFYEETQGCGHEWDYWDMILKKAISEWLPLKFAAIYPAD